MRHHPTPRRHVLQAFSAALLFLLMATPALAQPTGSDSGTETALAFTSILTIVIVALIFFILLVPEGERQKMIAALARMRRYIVPSVSDKVIEFKHDFDGISELDNRVPPWFTYLFAGTVVFGGIYLLDYHVIGSSKLSAGEYQEEIAAADVQRRVILAREGTIDENALTASKDPAVLAKGREEFMKFCVSCHGNEGQGVVGPNLTDDYWIHGGGIKNVYTTIKNGVPAKGMISWQLVFSPKQIQDIGSYVLSLRGKNPPNAKKAEGQLFVERDSSGIVAIKAPGKKQ